MILWPLRWLLRQILGVILTVLVGLVGILWVIQWVPFPPVAVVQGFFQGSAPKWGWLGPEDIPPLLQEGFQWTEQTAHRQDSPSLAEKTAVLAFYPRGSSATGSAWLGFLLENLWSEAHILQFYLNALPYDEDVYGIKAAAERRFQKPVAQLSPNEMAELIARRQWPHLSRPLPSWLRAEQERIRRFLEKKLSAAYAY